MRVLLILLTLSMTTVGLATFELTQALRHLEPELIPMSDQLNTPLTFTKNNIQITTTVTTNRQPDETDAEMAARHESLINATISAKEDNGWTLVSS